MADSKKPSATFRLWSENVEVLEPLAKLGFNCSEVVNEALAKDGALKRHVDRKIKYLKATLAEV